MLGLPLGLLGGTSLLIGFSWLAYRRWLLLQTPSAGGGSGGAAGSRYEAVTGSDAAGTLPCCCRSMSAFRVARAVVWSVSLRSLAAGPLSMVQAACLGTRWSWHRMLRRLLPLPCRRRT